MRMCITLGRSKAKRNKSKVKNIKRGNTSCFLPGQGNSLTISLLKAKCLNVRGILPGDGTHCASTFLSVRLYVRMFVMPTSGCYLDNKLCICRRC